MSYYEKISCRIAIQVCIGYFPDGRERHRTFSIKGINPDAASYAIASFARALAPVLSCPITKVRKVVKREIFFYEEAAMPIPQENAEPEARRAIPFPALEWLAVRVAATDNRSAAILPLPSLALEPSPRQMVFTSRRAPPTPGPHDVFSYSRINNNSLKTQALPRRLHHKHGLK